MEAISATVPTHQWHYSAAATRGQLHYETNDFIYLAQQQQLATLASFSVSQMIPTFDAISRFLGRGVKHFDFLCCVHVTAYTQYTPHYYYTAHSSMCGVTAATAPRSTTQRATAARTEATTNLRMCKQMTCQKNVGK